MATNEETIVSQYVPGFKANLNLAPQQTDSKLLGAVMSDLAYSKEGMEFNADDILPSDPQDVNTRVGDTPDKHAAFTRRVGFFGEFEDSAWIDNVDKTRELEDPTSSIMQSLMAGRWRKADSAILAGALGTAYERPNGYGVAPTSVAFPAGQVIGAADVSRRHQAEIVPDDGSEYGMSVGKLIEAELLLDDSELEGDRYIAMGPGQKGDLLQRTPTTSTFYNQVAALSEGKVGQTLLGFNVIWLPRKRLPSVISAVDSVSVIRRCVAWVKPALIYNARTITTAAINIRADKSMTPQAYYKAQHGISRRYDLGVVEIDCKE